MDLNEGLSCQHPGCENLFQLNVLLLLLELTTLLEPDFLRT